MIGAAWDKPEAEKLIDRLAPSVRSGLWALTADPFTRYHVTRNLSEVPARIQSAIFGTFKRTYAKRGHVAANYQIDGVGDAFGASMLSLASSDDEICQAAEQRAKAVRGMLSDVVMASTDYVQEKLERYAKACGVGAPKVKTLAGMVARMSDDKWWRRALRRAIGREVERHCIGFGMVHRRASIYASVEAVARRQTQKRRNARILETTEAVNEDGEVFTLAELSARAVSNPQLRRAELMLRARGFEEWADAAGYVGMFYTCTAPSRMHARLAASGDENPKYDGTTPRQAQAYLGATWAKVRAKLSRAGIYLCGIRVAEPHHDGTPHWHMLLFVRAGAADIVTQVMRDYFTAEDSHELNSKDANDARFLAVTIDKSKGSAAGYVAKYISKNIDGFGVGADGEGGGDAQDTCSNVEAWASTWGIRQFQQIGGPQVTIWRELRRVRERPQMELFGPAWEAADAGEWRDYIDAQGGIEIRRDERPLQLWKRDAGRMNCYHEHAEDVVAGVAHVGEPLPLATRVHEWLIRRARDTRGAGAGHIGKRSIGGARAGAVDPLGPVLITVRGEHESEYRRLRDEYEKQFYDDYRKRRGPDVGAVGGGEGGGSGGA